VKYRFILPVILFCASLVTAEGVTVSASLSSNKAGTEDLVDLSVSVQGAAGDVQTPVLPDIPGLKLYGGPFTSQNISMVNFQVSKSITYTWRFNPLQEGSVTIPSLTVQVGKEMYKTQPLLLEVVKGSVAQRPQRQSPFGSFGPGQSGRGRASDQEGDVLVRVTSNKRDLVVGEAVVLTYELLTQVRVQGISIETPPSYKGFWSESIDLPDSPQGRNVNEGGKAYVAYTIKQDVIFPTTAGDITLDPVAFRVSAVTASDFFGFGRPEEIVRKTEPVTLKIKPFPAAGKPKNFSGAVGTFSIQAKLDKDTVPAGDAVALTLTVSGQGNLRTLSTPDFPTLPDCSVYDPKATESIKVSEAGLKGSRSWEWVIVPRSKGTLTIPSFSFAYFNPAGPGTYQEAATRALTLTVQEGKVESTVPFVPAGGEEVKSLGRDIHFIVTASDSLKTRTRPFYASKLYVILVLFPFIANLLLFGFLRLREKRGQSLHLIRMRGAGKQAMKRLKEASGMAGSDPRVFFKRVRSSMTGYLADRLNRSEEGLTIGEVRNILQERGLETEDIQQITRTLERCDSALYAPGDVQSGELEQILKTARALIRKMEKVL